MEWNWKEYNKQKTLFRSYYCAGCKQTKPCRLLAQDKCCACHFQGEQEKAQKHSDYQQVYQQKVKEKKAHEKQLQLLRNYSGCKECGSKEVDAYFLYDENKLVCQPCLMRKVGSAAGAISFSEQEKWYKKGEELILLNDWKIFCNYR